VSSRPPRLSVIIPALDEEAAIAAAVRSGVLAGAEVIVADGGSMDRTVACAEAAGARVVKAERGRGPQMNAGAAVAGGDVLLFLHADSVLPPDAGEQVRTAFGGGGVEAATFRLRFDGSGPLLRLYEWCARLESPFTRFGDACIVVRAGLFRRVGGFPPWELLEDVALLRRLRARTRVRTLPAAVLTSARRFGARGVVRGQLKNGSLLLLFFLGVPPARLAPFYRTATGKTPPGQGSPLS
jgi:rSAM/selenodomain-associated transferase 2